MLEVLSQRPMPTASGSVDSSLSVAYQSAQYEQPGSIGG